MARRPATPTAALSASRWRARNKPPLGTTPESRTAASRSRTHRAFAKAVPAQCILLTFAIPMATSCARFIACRLPEPSRPQIKMDRPSRRSFAIQDVLYRRIRATETRRQLRRRHVGRGVCRPSRALRQKPPVPPEKPTASPIPRPSSVKAPQAEKLCCKRLKSENLLSGIFGVSRLRVELKSDLISTLPNSARRTKDSVREAEAHPPEHDMGRRQNRIGQVYVRTRGRNI
jgi:hypothetical protein